MGKYKRKNKEKNRAKPASNENETATHSISNTSGVKIHGKKCMNVDAEDIQAAGHSPQYATEEKKDEKSSLGSTDDVQAEGQSSQTPEWAIPDIFNEELRKVVDAIIDCMVAEIHYRKMSRLEQTQLSLLSAETMTKLISLQKKLNMLVADRDQHFIEYVENYIFLRAELSVLAEIKSTAQEGFNLAYAAAYPEIIKQIEQDIANAQATMATAQLEYGLNEQEASTLSKAEVDDEIKKRNEQDDANAQTTMATAQLEYGPDEQALYLAKAAMQEEIRKLDEQEDARAQARMAAAQLEYGQNKLSSDLETDEKVVMTCDYCISADNLQNALHSPHNVEVNKDGKANKDSNRCSDNTQIKIDSPQNVTMRKKYKIINRYTEDKQLTEQSSHSMESGLEYEPYIKEYMSIDKSFIGMTYFNTMEEQMSNKELNSRLKTIAKGQTGLNPFLMSQEPAPDKSMEKCLNLLLDSARKPDTLPEKTVTTSITAEMNEETKDSKELGRNKSNISNGDIQTHRHSPKDDDAGRKGTKEINKSTSDIQFEDSSINKELDFDKKAKKFINDIEEYPKKVTDFKAKRQPADMAMKTFPEKSRRKARSSEQLRLDLKGFLMLQNSKIEDQMKECNTGESNLKFKPNLLPIEKEKGTSPAQAQFEAGITTQTGDDTEKENLTCAADAQYKEGTTEDDKIKVSTTVEQYRTPDDVVIPLSKTEHIQFEFGTNGNKIVKVGSKNIFYRLHEKQNIIFDFKNEKVKVSFLNGQIFVATPNNEFDISVRKPQPIQVKDDATQTLAKP